jgi:hypothetical protein
VLDVVHLLSFSLRVEVLHSLSLLRGTQNQSLLSCSQQFQMGDVSSGCYLRRRAGVMVLMRGRKFFAASGAPLSSAPRVHAPRSSSRASHTRHCGDGWDGQAQLGFSRAGFSKLQPHHRSGARIKYTNPKNKMENLSNQVLT